MSSPTSALLAQSRRLLLPNLLSGHHSAPPAWDAADDPPSRGGPRSADSNAVMILAVLFCVLVCALGLSSVFRCVVRWSSQMAEEPMLNPVVRLAQAGHRRRALQRLPALLYSPGLKLAGSDPAECAICLAEFAPGEQVRLLPKCGHGFHLRCVDRWLMARSSCPTCRTRCLFGASEKASGCGLPAGGSRRAGQASTAAETVMVPLEPEGLITRYHFWSHQAIFAI